MVSNMIPYTWLAPAGVQSDIVNFLSEHYAEVDRTLLEHGAILFKNFNVSSAEEFHRCVNSLPVRLANYVDGNSPRTKLNQSVYTSTEYPPELPISLHNELSYAHKWPSRLYFCCITAPISGGSTTIADSRALLRDLSPATVGLFEQKGVTYVRNLHGGSGVKIGLSWQDTFETSLKSDVEAYCHAGDIKYEWKPDNGLRLIHTRSATATHPQTGDKVWFNQAEQFHPSTNPSDVYEALTEIYGDTPFDMPQYACFGDRSPIADEVLTEIRSIMKANTIAFPWQRGDLMVIDNMLTSHGRSPYSGPRKILVAMSV